jgi:flagellar protein FliO/FliZ
LHPELPMAPSTDRILSLETLLVVGAAALLALVAIAAAYLYGRRKEQKDQARIGRSSQRLRIVESLDIDPGHRLVLLRRDEVEHLVLVGPTSDLVVESDIGDAERRRRPGFLPQHGIRHEPEIPMRSRPSTTPVEEQDRDLEPAPLSPDHGADPATGIGAMRRNPGFAQLPVRASYREASFAAPSPARAASTQPARRPPPPPEPLSSRSAPSRASTISTRAASPPPPDAPREELPTTARRNLATPFQRAAPLPTAAPPEPELVREDDLATTESYERNESEVPLSRVEPALAETMAAEADKPPRPEPGPEATAAEPEPPDSDGAAPPAVPTQEFQDRASIDRLEAEIARLLGRTPSH